MRLEIVLALVTGLVVANIYTDGYVYRKVLSYRKYYEMAGVVGVALFMYFVIRKNPADSRKILMSTNEYVKYLPVDRHTTDMLTPILNLTSASFGGGGGGGGADDYAAAESLYLPTSTSVTNSLLSGGGGGGGGLAGRAAVATRRVVSETKKKFVAAKQNWRCNACHNQLNAWFEIDHVVRLEHGGSNHVDNLAALCRECHGQKTTIENL